MNLIREDGEVVDAICPECVAAGMVGECRHALLSQKRDAAGIGDVLTGDVLLGEWRKRVLEVNRRVADYARAVEDAKGNVDVARGELKTAQEMLARAVAMLRETIDGKSQSEFDFGEPSPVKAEPDTPSAASADGAMQKSDKLNGWREISLKALDVSPALIRALQDAGLHTVGQLSAWLAGPPQRTLRDIKGIGQAKAEQLADALECLWEGSSE